MELESVFGEAVNECSCEVVCATGCAVRMYSESMAKKETKMSKDEEEEKRLLAHLRQ